MLLLFCGPTRLRDVVVKGNPVAAALSEHLVYLEATPVSQMCRSPQRYSRCIDPRNAYRSRVAGLGGGSRRRNRLFHIE